MNKKMIQSILLIIITIFLFTIDGLSQFLNIRYSNNLLIPKKFPWTGVTKLTESDAKTWLSRSLFLEPIDIEYAPYFNEKINVVFVLDKSWQRIIAGKAIYNSSGYVTNSWLKSYGDNESDYKFNRPSSLTYADGPGELYIADTESGRIIKLLFDRNNFTFTLSQIVIIPGINNPTDIQYDRRFEPGLEDDLIWICDPKTNKIVKLDRQFNIVQTITGYIDKSGNRISIISPKKIMINHVILDKQSKADIPGSFGYITHNSFKILNILYGGDPLLCNSYEFSSSSVLSSIGLEYPDGWLISDEGLNCIHRFGGNGEYSASFKNRSGNNSLFKFPKFISSSGVKLQNKYLDICVLELWWIDSGMQNFFPGADVRDCNVVELPSCFRFNYTFTNRVKDSLKILNENREIVQSEYDSWIYSNSGTFQYDIGKNNLGYGKYIVRLSYAPMYDDNYGEYSQGWKVKEIPFTYPFDMSVNRGVIYWEQTSTITANTSSKPGLNYTWTTNPNPLPEGASFRVDNLYPWKAYLSNNYFNGKTPVPHFPVTISLTVSNPMNSYSKSVVVQLASSEYQGGGGCPFVYTWNGNEFVEDNNILPQSEYPSVDGQKEDGFVTDYYQLFTTPAITENTYRLRVGEFEQEQSVLDNFSLIAIDHEPEVSISVNENGDISQYDKPAAIANAQLDDDDVYKLVYELDNNYVEAKADETLQLTFEEQQTGVEKALLISAVLAPPGDAKKLIAGKVQQNIEGKMINTHQFRLRRNPSFIWIPVEDGQSKDGNLEVGITWQQKANVDFTELSHKLDLPYTTYECELVYAEHSQSGDVTGLLLEDDNNIAVLNPQEYVDLVFNAPPLEAGKKRSFIFVSRGRYERIEEPKENLAIKNQQANSSISQNIPTKYVLHQNHPNPFNPLTIINYQLPVNNYTILKIYDVLGREVATLVDEYKEAGYYDVNWDAVNVPSGVYLYKLTAGNFVDVKKLVLLK